MALHSLKVEIAASDLKIIKAGQNNLCITKCVNYQSKDMQGNVVFLDALTKDLAPNLLFRWEARHQTYMVYDFKDRVGMPAESTTNIYDIQQGMTANFDEDGDAKITGSPDAREPIVVKNNWKAGGSVAIAIYDPTIREFATTFISPPTLASSPNNLIPVEKVGVFFHSNYTTKTIIDPTKIEVFLIDLRDKEGATVRYEAGNWKIIG